MLTLFPKYWHLQQMLMDYIMNTKMDMHTSLKYITTVLNTFVPLDNDLREQLPMKVILYLIPN